MPSTKPNHAHSYESYLLPGEAFIRVNKNGTILFINEAATRLTGFTIENSNGSIHTIFQNCVLENELPPAPGNMPFVPRPIDTVANDDIVVGILNPSHKRTWLKVHSHSSKFSLKGETREFLVTIKPHLYIEPAPRHIPSSSLHAAFESLSDVIILLNANYNVTFFNKAAGAFSSQFMTEVFNVGSVLPEAFFKLLYPGLPMVFREVLKGKRHEFKPSVKALNQEDAYFSLKISPLTEEAQISGILIQLSDITVEYNLQKHLAKSNERLEAAINASKDIVFEAIPQGIGQVYLLLPPQFTELTGFSSEEIVTGKDLIDKVVHPEDREWTEHIVVKAQKELQLTVSLPVHRIICKDGTIKHITMKSIAFPDGNGNIARIVGIISDITETHILQKELKTINQRYEMASMAASDNFWELDVKTDLLYFNPDNLNRAFGYNVTSPMPFREYLELTRHPEVHNTIEEYRQRIREGRGDFMEFPVQKIRKANGNPGYALVKTIYLRNEAGENITVFGTSKDITDQYIAEQEVRTSNERFELASRASFDLLWDIDIATGMLTFKSGGTNMYGFDIPNPIPDKEFVRRLVHPDDQGQLFESTRSFIRSNDLQREFPGHRIVKADGSFAHVMVRVMAVRDASNKMTRMIGVSRDITSSYLAEQEIRQINERYEMASHASFDMIWERDYKTGHYYFSDAMSRIFGHDNKEAWTDKKVQDILMHPEDREPIADYILSAIAEKKKYIHCPPHRYIKSDGSIAYVHVHGISMYDDEGNPVRTVGVSRDITHIHVLEEKMAKEEIHHLQQIAKITIETQESEREELGRELHDNINQILAATKLNLEIAIKREEQRLPIIQKSHQNLEQAIKEIRQLSHNLILPLLDIGLTDTIKQLIDQVTTAEGPQFCFQIGDTDLTAVEKTVQLMLYRIIQEQISNVLKHSKASLVEIKIWIEHEKICLKIIDNGIGFDMQKKSQGIGLRNIKNRVKLYQGNVKISSKPGKGCTLGICIPLIYTKDADN